MPSNEPSKDPTPAFFMDIALGLAKQAGLAGEVPVGAVVVHQGKVIARGKNDREINQNPLGHAELHALKEASQLLKTWRLNECELYVTLEPCPMCLSACQQARISKVYYGAKDEKGGALCLGFHVHHDPRMNHRFAVEFLPNPECSSILSEFFAQRRAQKSVEQNKGPKT